MSDLTHFNAKGEAHMVDIGDKSITERIATAKGRVVMAKDTITHLRSGQTKKGDVLGVARLAGIMGAKQCANLIPLCHPLPLSAISVDFELDENAVEITATAKTTGQTGVEMEALTAVNIAALTIYDMLKSVDKTMQITDIRLILKDGGKSGRFEAP